ncbi:ABC transporter family substrate-binding protein [Pseudonocardia sp. GCM10023141]|uniref:ABC transporter family substrate-binding protein n=1 Tax=Pseudonocardia sp. GCM10023141 TaxID=3252653 RepID=UPI0036073EB3
MYRTRVAVILLVGAVLAACTNQPVDAPAPPPPVVATKAPNPAPTKLVVGVDALPAGFNPHLIADSSPVTAAVAGLVLPSVFRFDAQGVAHLDPTIATSATVTSTAPFTVSYELNLQASWTTNAPIAAEDFVYLWEQMRSQPGVVDAAGYRMITDVRSRAGGKAVDVVFSQPYPAWRQLFTDLLPAHLLKDAPGSWVGATVGGLPASAGPFKIISIDQGRGEVQLARNDLYWATPTVLDQLVLRKVDATTLAAGLMSGDVNVAIPEADPSQRTTLGTVLPAPHLQTAPQPTVTQLGMRGDSGPVSDPRVRQAIAAIVDRVAVRAVAAPESLPADALGLAPSEPGYTPTAPPRPDANAAAALLTSAGWTRDSTTGRWSVGGAPVQLTIGAAAERPEDLRVAEAVAGQLRAAGIAVTVVSPSAVDLFSKATVPATLPSGSPTPSPTPTPTAAPSATPTPTVVPSTTGPPVPAGSAQVDLMVFPRSIGGDLGTELSSDYGCPLPSALVREPPRSTTGFCFPALQPLLDELLSPSPRPDTAATVEKILWQQMPVLPLFQPVSLVVSTAAADALTGIGPGPIGTGPLTGAETWRAPKS